MGITGGSEETLLSAVRLVRDGNITKWGLGHGRKSVANHWLPTKG